jgi:SAM-dependent methyltransferase
VANALLELGRSEAAAAGLHWLHFRRGDMASLGFADRQFDAVVCVFGIFFASDMRGQVAELWRMLRSGGQLAVTTWGPRLFAPAYEVWLRAVRRVRPDLHTAHRPWERTTTSETVRKLLPDSGVGDLDVSLEEGSQTLHVPSDFWTIVMGSGLRWTIDQLGNEQVREVKREVLERLSADRVTRIETNVIYAVARKQ